MPPWSQGQPGPGGKPNPDPSFRPRLEIIDLLYLRQRHHPPINHQTRKMRGLRRHVTRQRLLLPRVERPALITIENFAQGLRVRTGRNCVIEHNPRAHARQLETIPLRIPLGVSRRHASQTDQKQKKPRAYAPPVPPIDRRATGVFCCGAVPPIDRRATGVFCCGAAPPIDRRATGVFCCGCAPPIDSTATAALCRGAAPPGFPGRPNLVRPRAAGFPGPTDLVWSCGLGYRPGAVQPSPAVST